MPQPDVLNDGNCGRRFRVWWYTRIAMATADTTTEPLETGVPGFDRALDGGLPAGRLYVLCGPPGSGKTTFSSRVVATGAAQGDRCLFVTMHETIDQLIADMSQYDFGFEHVAQSDRVEFINVVETNDRNPLQKAMRKSSGSSVNQLTNRLISYIESRDIDRVVIDSTMVLEYLLTGTDTDLVPFVTRLKQADATVLLISEMTDPSAYAPEHYLAHGVIFFHNFLEEDGMRRGLQILKMRGVPISSDIRPLAFTAQGLEVKPDQPT